MIKKNTFFGIVITVIIILLIPFVAMQITNEVNWSLFDFTVMGVLLFALAFTDEFILRKVKNKKHRIVFCGLLIIIVILLWIELSVGLFGSPMAGS